MQFEEGSGPNRRWRAVRLQEEKGIPPGYGIALVERKTAVILLKCGNRSGASHRDQTRTRAISLRASPSLVPKELSEAQRGRLGPGGSCGAHTSRVTRCSLRCDLHRVDVTGETMTFDGIKCENAPCSRQHPRETSRAMIPAA